MQVHSHYERPTNAWEQSIHHSLSDHIVGVVPDSPLPKFNVLNLVHLHMIVFSQFSAGRKPLPPEIYQINCLDLINASLTQEGPW